MSNPDSHLNTKQNDKNTQTINVWNDHQKIYFVKKQSNYK